MRNDTITHINGCRVVLMDSISLIGPNDVGTIIISGSHGGQISGAFAALHAPSLVIFNDAAVGKNCAGIASLHYLASTGIAAATVSHTSARIGDALDAWESGVVSHRNSVAVALGVDVGASSQEAVSIVTRSLKARRGGT
jgi:hypothetical protein